MRKIGKGLILTALFAVCTVGMVGVNLNAALCRIRIRRVMISRS